MVEEEVREIKADLLRSAISLQGLCFYLVQYGKPTEGFGYGKDTICLIFYQHSFDYCVESILKGCKSGNLDNRKETTARI